HYCTPQAPFIYPEQCYNQDFNFSQDFKMSHNNILVVMIAGLLMTLTNSPVIHQPPQELSIPRMEDLKQQYLDKLQRLSNLEYCDEIKIAELKENFNGMSIEIRKKEKLLQEA
nr:hypothetical protein [Tanacetum cinerariifolium]